jgi:hypothetical protein
MGRIVESYEEPVVVTTAKRFVHVVEDTAAHVEAWHGGRLVDTLGGWTSTAAAIRDAGEKARRFGVGTLSSMSIVVREEIRRSRVLGDKVDPDRRGDTLQREVTVAERYVHDAVFGPRTAVPRKMAFAWAMPVQFSKTTDWPGDGLKDYFRALTIRGWRPEFLYGGFGYRNLEIDRVSTRLARPDEIPPDAERKKVGPTPECWMVVFEGTIEVLSPISCGIDKVVEALGAEDLDLDIFVDWRKDRERIQRERWAIWTGSPATKPMLWRPAPESQSAGS